MILDNPFHILGLPADCSPREFNRRKSQIQSYLRVGKPLRFDEDLCFDPRLRNQASVDRALRQLQDGSQRIQYGLFWFSREGLLGTHAVRMLAAGDRAKALRLLKRAESGPVTADKASGLNCLGTLCLLESLRSAEPRRAEHPRRAGALTPQEAAFLRGVRVKARLLGQLAPPDLSRYCASLGDELSARDPDAIIAKFGESLERSIEEAKKYGVRVDTRRIASALEVGGPRCEPIRAALGSSAREAIERAIQACATSVRNDRTTARDAAKTLERVLDAQLPALAAAVSKDDLVYRTLADEAAERLLDAGVAYYNSDVDGSEPEVEISRAEAIVQAARRIAIGPAAQQRAADDLDRVRQIRANLDQNTRFAKAFLAVQAWFALCRIEVEGDSSPIERVHFVEAALSGGGDRSIVSLLRAMMLLAGDSTGEMQEQMIGMNSSACQALVSLLVRAYNDSAGEGVVAERVDTNLDRLAEVFVSPSQWPGRKPHPSFPVDQESLERLNTNRAAVLANQAARTAVLANQAARTAATSQKSGGCLVVFIVGLLGLLALPWIADAAPVQEPSAMRRQLDSLEVEFRETQDRILALEAGRARDAETIRGLRAALAQEGAARETLAEQTGADTAALGERLDGTEQTQGELAAGVESLRTEIGSRVDAEAGQRAGGDRRIRWWVGAGLGIALVFIGLLSRKARAEVRQIGQRITRSAKTQREQAEAGFASVLAAIEASSRAPTPAPARTPPTRPVPAPASDPEPDHKLVLLTCDEINRMENNLRHMDPKVRGHKKLLGVVRRMKQNLRTRGYEIIEHYGKRYDPGLTVIAEDVTKDDDLPPGVAVISWIKRPEVRFEGKIVQPASVRVSEGP